MSEHQQHGRRVSSVSNGDAGAEDEDVDMYDRMISESGCSKQHFALQDCFHDGGRDWRKCGEEMRAFKLCMKPAAKTKR